MRIYKSKQAKKSRCKVLKITAKLLNMIKKKIRKIKFMITFLKLSLNSFMVDRRLRKNHKFLCFSIQ